MQQESSELFICSISWPAGQCRAGEVLAWGINDFGQLGNGSTFYETSPTKVVGLEDVRIADIAAGGWHSLALTTEGGKAIRQLQLCT